MAGNEQQELLTELMVVENMIRENPCRMNMGLIGALKEVMRSFVGKYCIESASKDQVASYLQRDVRTITRWQKDYHDFPQPRHEGHREVSYNWHDVVLWKMKHKEIYG